MIMVTRYSTLLIITMRLIIYLLTFLFSEIDSFVPNNTFRNIIHDHLPDLGKVTTSQSTVNITCTWYPTSSTTSSTSVRQYDSVKCKSTRSGLDYNGKKSFAIWGARKPGSWSYTKNWKSVQNSHILNCICRFSMKPSILNVH